MSLASSKNATYIYRCYNTRSMMVGKSGYSHPMPTYSCGHWMSTMVRPHHRSILMPVLVSNKTLLPHLHLSSMPDRNRLTTLARTKTGSANHDVVHCTTTRLSRSSAWPALTVCHDTGFCPAFAGYGCTGPTRVSATDSQSW